MIGFGPFPASVIVVLLAVIAAAGAGALAARRKAPGTTRKIAGLIADMTLVGLLAAGRNCNRVKKSKQSWAASRLTDQSRFQRPTRRGRRKHSSPRASINRRTIGD